MINEQLKSNTTRLVRIREVMQLTGLSKSYIYQLTAQKSFPDRVRLVKGGTAVAWDLSEIHEWINERIADRNGNHQH
jgi:prophage regulatory protein